MMEQRVLLHTFGDGVIEMGFRSTYRKIQPRAQNREKKRLIRETTHKGCVKFQNCFAYQNVSNGQVRPDRGNGCPGCHICIVVDQTG